MTEPAAETSFENVSDEYGLPLSERVAGGRIVPFSPREPPKEKRMTSPQHRKGRGGPLVAAVAGVLVMSLAALGLASPAQAARPPVAEADAIDQWTGWGELPGGGATPDSPAAVSYNGNQNVFVRGTDNAIYRNVL
ncbi:hypothetical protein, partial [Actinoplanes sp. NPDC049118]|uniref:hypothetical protein n=1 Tax=Actinoplanes sp. NPDC049118 TaxID=3155769 RepID=UPI0033CB4AC9